MPYLIDGHNLIGRMRDIRLADPDDEALLVARLRTFCSRERTTITVYFDGAVVSATRDPAQAGVTARFIAPPQTADAAIARHIGRLGRAARNWTVVSSDSAVVEASRRRGARVESSEAFARRLEATIASAPVEEKPRPPTAPDEIAGWEAAFKKPRGDHPGD
jgi:predicted RNA-binding protein with PIN domain